MALNNMITFKEYLVLVTEGKVKPPKWTKKYPKGNPEKPSEVSVVIPGVGRVKPGQEKHFKDLK